MTLRSARRAARRAFHRAAHLDTFAAVPDHEPEDCDVSETELDIQPYRLDAMLEAAVPILRRHAIQEHARRYGRRTVQLTPAEVAVVRAALWDVIEGLETDAGRDRADTQRLAAARRARAKLDALDA